MAANTDEQRSDEDRRGANPQEAMQETPPGKRATPMRRGGSRSRQSVRPDHKAQIAVAGLDGRHPPRVRPALTPVHPRAWPPRAGTAPARRSRHRHRPWPLSEPPVRTPAARRGKTRRRLAQLGTRSDVWNEAVVRNEVCTALIKTIDTTIARIRLAATTFMTRCTTHTRVRCREWAGRSHPNGHLGTVLPSRSQRLAWPSQPAAVRPARPPGSVPTGEGSRSPPRG